VRVPGLVGRRLVAESGALALVVFAALGLAGWWPALPALLLAVGFAVLPGLAAIRPCRGACARDGVDCPLTGPGSAAFAFALSQPILLLGVLPLFAFAYPLVTARWTLAPLLLAIGLIGLALPARASAPAPSARTAWIAAAVALALLLPGVIHYAGGTVDDWWDLAFVRAYAERSVASFEEPFLATGRVHPRFAWNGWLVVQALVLAFTKADPADFQAGPLAGLTCVLTVSAAAAFARAIFGRARTAAVAATLLFFPLWIWGTEAIPYFTRLHQDKFVAALVLVPTMMAAAILQMRHGGPRFALLAAATTIATACVHGVVFAVGALGVLVVVAAAAACAPRDGAVGTREVIGRAIVPFAAIAVAAMYPAWQALAVRSWFAAEGIALSASDNPVVRAHLGLERLIAPGSWAYVVHPGAVFGPIALLPLCALPLAWRMRSGLPSLTLLGLAVAPCVLVFVPGVASIAGAVFVPWMLYRVGWLVPVAALAGLLFERVAQQRRARVLIAMSMIAIALAVPVAIDRVRRDMLEHPSARDRMPRGGERDVYHVLSAWPESGSVIAPSGFSALVGAMSGRPSVAVSERGTLVFSGDELEAYRRLRDRSSFFAFSTAAEERDRIARERGVRLVVFRKRLLADGSERRWLWRAGPEGFLASEPDRGSASIQWSSEALRAAVPPTWPVVFEDADFAVVRTPYGRPDARTESGGSGQWSDVFSPDLPDSTPPGNRTLAAVVGWPGGEVSYMPVPLGLGVAERPVWIAGEAVWDDGPETVEVSLNLGADCKVEGLEVVPFLRTKRREVFEIHALGQTRRLRAEDGVPLVLRVEPQRLRSVQVRVRSMVGEPFAFWNLRVIGDPRSCATGWSPASRARVAEGEVPIAELLELAARYPHDARAAVGLSRRLTELGERADARAVLSAALGRDPQAAPVWLELGLLHDADGEFEPARRAYARALRLDSNSAWARGCVAWAELRRSRPLRALYQAWRASRLDPRYADAYTIMGSSVRALHWYSAARTLYRRAIRLDPQRSWPYIELARMSSEAGDAAEARSVLADLLTVAPDDAQARAMVEELGGPAPAPVS
jgi:Tfp pilus assembly protein PilF